ncbi:lipopolysaccharide assembly protein LapB [uncultured Alistipes sp.]|jgi:tetratricopeptide (TPR) repeat protein|uniref:tetratricopeptide repeat protein n=1 Tax=uncultured Alistipes sp. TaxID=538949 RepID=UPI0023D329DC|nr:enzyme of heme biosynthesis [uncultured Alistipes sp.]MDE7005895.1 enzyme of heme biosynthesis [Alistipes sp.]
MKNVRFILVAAAAFCAVSVSAQQDFSGPQYAKWGDTPEAREKNILNSNFLKEACDNKDYNAAAQHLRELIEACPDASENIYVRGAVVYKNKINRAKSLAEKKAYVDSLLWMYDLRNQYFGSHPKRGTAYILDRKAREYLTYLPNDRAGIRSAFRDAIAAGGADTDPETVTVYFSNLCEDYKNTDEVMPDEIIAEYDRLSPLFGENAGEYKSQFDAAFGLSGAASCANLEKLFRTKLENAPDDEALLAQAVALMSRAKCDGDFYFAIAEKYYEVKPSSETAMFLAQAFQNKGDYAKATKYLNEALATETDPVEQQKLYVRIALVELVANHIPGAAAAARSARDLNPEDGVPYFVLAQCYGVSAGQCGGFAGQAAFWAAYDTMARAIELLPSDSEYIAPAKTSLSSFRNRFPTSEECFFNELQEGARYTVSCGTAAGVATTVRFR